MTVDDLFGLEQLVSVSLSPDGNWWTLVVARARSSRETYALPSGQDVTHADVWLAPRRGGQARNITHGAADGSGFWNPVWSPDSRRLALLSSKGGDNIRPYVWDLARNELKRLTDRGVDLGAAGDPGVGTYSMVWSDSTTLLCPVEAEVAVPAGYRMVSRPLYTKVAREWARAAQGAAATVSVLTSGRETPGSERPEGALLAIDAVSGNSRVIIEGNFRQILTSPARRHIALIAETGRMEPSRTRLIAYQDHLTDLWRTRLAIVTLGDTLRARWIDTVRSPWLVLGDAPHSWSPDGSVLAVVSKADSAGDAAQALWIVMADSGTARRVTGPQLEVAAAGWSGGGNLLAFARDRSGHSSRVDSRFDWWAIDASGTTAPRVLTARLGSVPTYVTRTPNRSIVSGIAAGELWTIDVTTGATTNQTAGFQPMLIDDGRPQGAYPRPRPAMADFVLTSDRTPYQIKWIGRSAMLRPLPRPSQRAELLEFQPDLHSTAFVEVGPDGTAVWTGDGQAAGFTRRVTLNAHVQRIADPRRRILRYRSLDGDSLNALLLLPINYHAGTRYPLVTWIYPGRIIHDTTSYSFMYGKQVVSSLNWNLLASHGYAVLIPSMPLPPDGYPSDPYLEVPKGVLSAVDKAIELGIADPNRLAVMGHSFGGYATYSLVAYTHRFKAAIALAGPVDLVSLYGQFPAFERYHDFPHEELFQPALAESGQMRMGANLWDNVWRYLRNSPILYADRIETPLMIVQGDIDYVSIQQGEELFTALYRLGKKAQFVRYWGEGHVLESPANTRDLWQRIFEWLGIYCGAVERPKSSHRLN